MRGMGAVSPPGAVGRSARAGCETVGSERETATSRHVIQKRRTRACFLALLSLVLPQVSQATTPPASSPPSSSASAFARQPLIRIDDVARFYTVYDKARGKPSATELQQDYLDSGSAGLHQFVTTRITSAQKLVDAIAKSPADFRQARQCMAALPAVRERLRPVFSALARLDPQASFPPVTIVVGRNNSGGTTTSAGVIIGLEVVCRSNWLDPDIVQRLVHLIAHEYVHVQQPAAQVEPPADASLLFASLVEGGAEFIGELTSGDILNSHLKRWTRDSSCRIERDFQAQAMGSDSSRWLYNGPGTADKPGDLGYWVGYRIVSAYYAHARDKSRAIQDILHVSPANAAGFLEHSHWRAEDCRPNGAGGAF
ncbi:hypothetical protein RLIN73S_03447 [Rhodanobacter lindaniclasticus]